MRALIAERFNVSFWIEKHGTGYRVLGQTAIHNTCHIVKQAASLPEARLILEKILRKSTRLGDT